MNIIETYLKIAELKEVVRTGWTEVGIPADKVESVMDHVGGTLFLAILINAEKNLGLDMGKVSFKIAFNEVKKLEGNVEYSITQNNEYGSNIVGSLVGNSEYLMGLYNDQESKEAKFAVMVAKFESDIQAKKYEKAGLFTLENAKRDIEAYGSDKAKALLPTMTKASEGWLANDSQFYDELFLSLSSEVNKL